MAETDASFVARLAAAAAAGGCARTFDRARADEIVAETAPPTGAEEAVRAAAGGAPFLARLLRREAAWVARLWARSPEETLRAELAQIAALEGVDEPTLRARLRISRRRVALVTALADLGGVWDVAEATDALSRFAEAAATAATAFLLGEEAAAGRIDGLDPARSGFVLIGMGKLGARELNYSSDIDLIALFDQDRLPARAHGEAKHRFVRLTQRFARILSDIDAEGYVARVDLRLRPDPGATPACLAMETAERYYEAMGRTWERAAHIKARPIAGDLEAGAAYLKRLAPFVWRRRLDFAAIEDAADMLRRIRAHEGGAEVAVAGQDVKLGAGGIREIEFLAQTEQLILGGRHPELRAPRTLDALAALTRQRRISAWTRDTLGAAYETLRRVEHRLQMVEDQQTHRLPNDRVGLARIAALTGARDVEAFVDETRATMASVRGIAGRTLDGPAEVAGGDPVAAAAAALPEPARALEFADRWFSGRLRAVRSTRARASLERLTPQILTAMAAAPDPMRALAQFDRFLSGLPAGVQLLAMFEATPRLLSLLTEICAAAPRLADLLASRSNLLDAVIDPDFFADAPGLAARRDELASQLALEAARSDGDYERALDTARRWAREKRFQIGVGLLRSAPAAAAGAAFADVAQACVQALWPVVLERHAARFGPPPGRGAAVLALGKLGSREMTATSDLDLILIYDADQTEMSDGPKPTPAGQYYARLTQALTGAISAPTAEGALYEVDMRLRPSGNSGPLATSLSAFQHYQRREAWVWEHLALTRARPIAGAPAVREATRAAVSEALATLRPADAVRQAALEMRGKLRAAHPKAAGRIWALKHTGGGLVDLEFIAQTGVLIGGVAGYGGLSTVSAFERMGAVGLIDEAEAAALAEAYTRLLGLHQVERMALERPLDDGGAPAGLRPALAAAVGRPEAGLAEIEGALSETQAAARAAFDAWFQVAPTAA